MHAPSYLRHANISGGDVFFKYMIRKGNSQNLDAKYPTTNR